MILKTSKKISRNRPVTVLQKIVKTINQPTRMYIEYLLLLSGFAILILSGKYLVKGSVSLAFRYKVSKLVIGLTVVAFGTSAPELFVSLFATVRGHPAITIGNVVGSNIANIALVLGITAIIFPIPVRKNSVKIDWPVMMVASLLFYVFILDRSLKFFEGLFFILFLVAYLVLSIHFSRKNYTLDAEITDVHYSKRMSVLAILFSTIGLALGSYLLVENASSIARTFGISERVISITLIAFGTSIPELVTSAAAAFHKEMDISIGNIIGSNIFNILGVLGITSVVKSIAVPEQTLSFDIYWMLGIAILLFLFILPLKGGRLTRTKGLILFVVYCVYVYLLFKSN